jgi:hypothetical protein
VNGPQHQEEKENGMKTIALVAALAFASAASADVVVFDFGDNLLGADESAGVLNFDLAAGEEIVNVFVTMDYVDLGNGSWASDIQLRITDPNNVTTYIGGLSTPRDFDFPFQGSQSTNTGHYEGDIADWVSLSGVGTWSIEYINDWAGHSGEDEWNNLEAHLDIIPTPGALALLGIAGLAGRRRRR